MTTCTTASASTVNHSRLCEMYTSLARSGDADRGRKLQKRCPIYLKFGCVVYVRNVHTHCGGKTGRKTHVENVCSIAAAFSAELFKLSRTKTFISFAELSRIRRGSHSRESSLVASKVYRSTYMRFGSFRGVYALGRAANSRYEHRRIRHPAFSAR